MNAVQNINPASRRARILSALDDAPMPLTRVEIEKRVPDYSKEQVRKCLNGLVYEKKIHTTIDKLGVTYYERSLPEELVEVVTSNINTGKFTAANPSPAWDTLIQEAEERGFARGYAAGAQSAQREAFEAGKRAFFKKMEAMLS